MPISAQPETGRLDLSASSGAYRATEFQIADATGTAVTGWTGAAAPSIQVWTGDDREAISGTGLSAVWTDDTDGIISVISSGSHILDPAVYQWRMLATFDTKTYEVCRGNYVVNPAPGGADDYPDSTTSPYTTIEDLRTLYSGIEQLQGKHDRTGMAEHQEAARAWFDDVILSAWRNNGSTLRTYPSRSGWESDVDYPPKWLRDVLASGCGVKITPRIRRACAAYACYSAFSSQLVTNEAESSYRKKAVQFRMMAHNEIISMTVWIKSTVTASTFTIPVNLGIAARN